MTGLIAIFVLSLFSLWMAAAAGMALGLEPHILAATLTVGYGCSVALIVIAGAPLRRRLLHRLVRKPNGVMKDIVNRYGVIGLGLLAPVVTGAPVGTALGLTMSATPRRLWLCMTAGAALWSVVLAVAALIQF